MEAPVVATQTDLVFGRLKKRAEFLRVGASGRKFVTTAFIMQYAEPLESHPTHLRYGLTATKKLGHAVIRNRARRRLRALAESTLKTHARAGDYVLIAREAVLTRDFAALRLDLEKALKVLKCSRPC